MGSGLCSGVEVEPSLKVDKLAGGKLVARQRNFAPVEGVGPSASSKEGSGQGECLLFLEFAKDVPYRDALRDLTCEAVSTKSHGRPFVRAWAESDGGELLGRVAEWPAKSCNEVPSWYWAQSLGFVLSKHRDAARLKLELRDQSELLGSLDAPLKELPECQAVLRDLTETRPARLGKGASRVSFQILDASAVTDKRTVYFVRHAESEWNKAQSKLDLNGMARTTDHPLSLKGRQQAESLSKRLALAASSEKEAAEVAGLCKPDMVYSSPLTRAVQTAVIALGPMLTKSLEPGEERDVLLMAQAREKLNFGGFDTWSTKKGEDIVRGTLEGLHELFKGEEDPEALRAFDLLRFDAQEVQDRWWCEGVAESPAQLEARLQEFMSQLLYSPHQNIVVVGHSHFFRSVLKTFLAKEFKEGKTGKDFGEKIIENCGVVRLDLDPTRGLAGGPIVKAELMLGSTFVEKGQGLLSCCTAVGQAPKDPDGSPTAPGEAEQEQRVVPQSVEKYEAAAEEPQSAAEQPLAGLEPLADAQPPEDSKLAA